MLNSIPSNIYSSHLNGKGFYPRSGHVGFEVEVLALGLVFFEYLGLP
jgi:hypothetical protein